MQLNYNCVRDLLLTLEANLEFGENLQPPLLSLNQIQEYRLMNDYDEKTIAYTAIKLTEAGFIGANIKDTIYGTIDIQFRSISFNGHQYLDRIRDESLWGKVKGRISQAGSSISVEVISAVAIKLLSEKLGL